ncbi:MAG TPA: M28 family peptidase [Bacteroidales bacterium]|nr:M28 family peptidase [Bacteroidales bacterium]
MKADKNRMYADIDFLTSLQPARHYLNTESLGKATDYISDQLIKAGLQPERQTWSFSTRQYSNIVAKYKRGEKKRMVIGAHYDVAGDQPGADDNASGIAGLLETARLISAENSVTGFGIDFVAYCLEEPPFFGTINMGSYIHARSLNESKTNVMGMIGYEMIGYFSDERNSQSFPDPRLKLKYPSTGNFIMVVGIEEHCDFNKKVHRLMKKDSEIDVRMISFPSPDSLAGMSDQRNYWKFGYKAVMINDTAEFRNKNYHCESDTIDTLDFTRMAQVVDGVCNAVRYERG